MDICCINKIILFEKKYGTNTVIHCLIPYFCFYYKAMELI